MKDKLSIINLEDNKNDSELILEALKNSGIICVFKQTDNKEGFVNAIRNEYFDIILADYSIPGYDGLSALKVAKNLCPETPFLFVSGAFGEEIAIECLKMGAKDYILKDKLYLLPVAIQRALQEKEDTIHRKITEIALLESEEKYRLLIENLNVGVFMSSFNGRILHANSSLIRIYGFDTIQDFASVNAQKLYANKSDRTKFIQHLNKYGFVKDWTWEAKKKNGNIFWISISAVLINANDGTPKTILGIIDDITERKSAEKQLLSKNEELKIANETARENEYWLKESQRVAKLGSYILDINNGNWTSSDILNTIFGIDNNYIRTFESWADIIHPEYKDDMVHYFFSEVFIKKNPFNQIYKIVTINSHQEKWVHGLGELVFDENGKPIKMLGTIQDITALKISEEALYKSEEKFRSLVETSSDWIVEFDVTGTFTYVSPQVKEMLGYEPHEVIGQKFKNFVCDEDALKLEKIFKNGLQRYPNFTRIEIQFLNKNGQVVVIEGNANPFFNNKGTLLGYRGVNRDITERKKAQKMLDFLAHHDYLTGLPNRMLFNKQLRECIEKSSNNKIAILFIDLDHFKNINDSLGHQVGDELLQMVSTEIAVQIKNEGTLARLGGDEFIIFLTNANEPEMIIFLASKILNVLSRPFKVNEQELFITATIGISMYPDDGQDVNTLVKNADIAMYHAKNYGRNRYQFYNQDMANRITEKLIIENLLRYAISRNELSVHYQPQINMKTGKLIGAEALIRWNNPQLGFVSPLKFISIAEENGFIAQLGEWVLRTVCKQINEWNKIGFKTPKIAVNISVKQMEQTNFFDLVQKILLENKINPNSIELEITESVIMMQTEQNISIMDKLKKNGFELSVDDFGTGYSSLKYLQRLPIHKLKIDQSFVKDIAKDPNDEAIVRAIIALAKSMNLSVIAEGVENEEQKNFLILEGCSEGQGYLFSKPIKPDDFLKQWNN